MYIVYKIISEDSCVKACLLKLVFLIAVYLTLTANGKEKSGMFVRTEKLRSIYDNKESSAARCPGFSGNHCQK